MKPNSNNSLYRKTYSNAFEQQMISGGSLENAESVEAPSLVIAVVADFEASMIQRNLIFVCLDEIFANPISFQGKRKSSPG